MKTYAKRPTTCYFETEETRRIEEIAEKEERSNSQIVQFAVRVFVALYRADPNKARQMAQEPMK